MAEGNALDNRINLVNTSHEIDRTHTLTLKVEIDGPIEARLVLLSMKDYDKDMLEHTTCLQQISRNTFRWSMLSPGDVKKVLYHISLNPLKIGTYNTHIEPAGKVPMVILYDTPYEFDNKKVGELMSRYGEIANIKRTTFREFPTVYDGRVLIYYKSMDHNIPREIRLGTSGRILVRLPGEKVTGLRPIKCMKCGELNAHKTEDCNNVTVCFRCWEDGHRMAECTNHKRSREEVMAERELFNRNASSTPDNKKERPPPPNLSKIDYKTGETDSQDSQDEEELSESLEHAQRLDFEENEAIEVVNIENEEKATGWEKNLLEDSINDLFDKHSTQPPPNQEQAKLQSDQQAAKRTAIDRATPEKGEQNNSWSDLLKEPVQKKAMVDNMGPPSSNIPLPLMLRPQSPKKGNQTAIKPIQIPGTDQHLLFGTPMGSNMTVLAKTMNQTDSTNKLTMTKHDTHKEPAKERRDNSRSRTKKRDKDKEKKERTRDSTPNCDFFQGKQ